MKATLSRIFVAGAGLFVMWLVLSSAWEARGASGYDPAHFARQSAALRAAEADAAWAGVRVAAWNLSIIAVTLGTAAAIVTAAGVAVLRYFHGAALVAPD